MKIATALLLKIVGWYNLERVFGFSSIIIAILIAIPHFYTGSILEAFSLKTAINGVIVSHWFLFAGVTLLVLGERATFTIFSLAIVPMLLISLGIFIYSVGVKLNVFIDTHHVTLIDVSLSFVVCSIIVQRAIVKLIKEIINATIVIEIENQ